MTEISGAHPKWRPRRYGEKRWAAAPHRPVVEKRRHRTRTRFGPERNTTRKPTSKKRPEAETNNKKKQTKQKTMAGLAAPRRLDGMDDFVFGSFEPKSIYSAFLNGPEKVRPLTPTHGSQSIRIHSLVGAQTQIDTAAEMMLGSTYSACQQIWFV